MDIIIKGRHTSIPDRFREHAVSKLGKLEKLDHKAIRIDVEVTRERNPRQSGHRERVELTIRSRGPVIRAEAAADSGLVLEKIQRIKRISERLRPFDLPMIQDAPVFSSPGRSVASLATHDSPHHRISLDIVSIDIASHIYEDHTIVGE